MTLKWLAVCVMLDYGNASVRQFYSIFFFKKLFLQVSLYLNGNKAQIKNKAEIRMMKDDFRDSRG